MSTQKDAVDALAERLSQDLTDAGIERAIEAFARPRRRPIWLPLSVSAAAAMTLIAVFWVASSRADANALGKIAVACSNVRNSHQLYADPKGFNYFEAWQKDDLHAEEYKRRPDRLTVGFDGKRIWRYWPDRRMATIASEKSAGTFTLDVPQDLPALAETIRSSPATRRLSTKQVRVDGREAIQLTISSHSPGMKASETDRIVYLVDPSSHLPYSLSIFDSAGTLKATSSIDYPETIPDNRFRLRPPSDCRVIDGDQFAAELDARVVASIASKEFEGHPVQLHCAIAGPTGELEVVWRGGDILAEGAVPTLVDAAGRKLTTRKLSEFSSRRNLPDGFLAEFTDATDLKLPLTLTIPVCVDVNPKLEARPPQRITRIAGYVEFVVKDVTWADLKGLAEMRKRLPTLLSQGLG